MPSSEHRSETNKSNDHDKVIVGAGGEQWRHPVHGSAMGANLRMSTALNINHRSSEGSAGSTRYRGVMIAVLTLLFAFNNVDRLAIGILLQSIKLDLHLSDTELGLLSGIAFALFYSTMGIPIAAWADRGDRVKIIAVTTAIWSAMVALSASAANFAQLLLIRAGVAVGEAGCVPPSHSLIAEYYPRAERPRAFSRYMLAGPIALLFGYFGAGWLNEYFGWRTTFLLLALPGIVLAPIAWFVLREPRRRAAAAGARAPTPTDAHISGRGLVSIWSGLWRIGTFRHLLLAFAVQSFFSNGINKWQPAFFVRSFGMGTGELGTWYAVVMGIAGLLGAYLGGEWFSRYAANNEKRQLTVVAATFPAFSLLSCMIYLAPNHYVAFAFIGVTVFGGAATLGPILSNIQTLVPEQQRASASALVYLVANLIGMGLGPLAAGMLSDTISSWAGQESLRYSLLALCPGYLWASWHAWRASRLVERDVAAASNTGPVE